MEFVGALLHRCGIGAFLGHDESNGVTILAEQGQTFIVDTVGFAHLLIGIFMNRGGGALQVIGRGSGFCDQVVQVDTVGFKNLLDRGRLGSE